MKLCVHKASEGGGINSNSRSTKDCTHTHLQSWENALRPRIQGREIKKLFVVLGNSYPSDNRGQQLQKKCAVEGEGGRWL